MIKEPIKRGIRILSNPKKEFENLNSRTFESVVGDYMQLLVLVAVLAGFASFLYSLVRAIYLDFFLNVDLQYLNMLNYSLGRSASLIFFYLFAGTFLLFFLSLILKPLFHRVKYISLLKILFYSLTPFLLFSWIFSNPLPLLIWTAFLVAIGIRNYKHFYVKEDSIHKRD